MLNAFAACPTGQLVSFVENEIRDGNMPSDQEIHAAVSPVATCVIEHWMERMEDHGLDDACAQNMMAAISEDMNDGDEGSSETGEETAELGEADTIAPADHEAPDANAREVPKPGSD